MLVIKIVGHKVVGSDRVELQHVITAERHKEGLRGEGAFVAMGFLRSMVDRYLRVEEMMLSDVEIRLLAMLADPAAPSDLMTSAMGWLEDWQNGLKRPIIYALADKGLVVLGLKPSVTARGTGVLNRKHQA